MKKLFSTLTLAACLGVFVSCTDNEQEMDMFKPANTNSEIEVINGGTMIKFRDMSAYQNALLKVSAMSAQERINYLDSLSFKPQVMIMKEADGELENICNMAADRTSFDALYQKYKQKYGQVFMFNESDPSDLSPYSRLFCPVDEHFVNSEGQFMIGDSLVNSKMYNDFEESEQQFTMVTTRDASTITSVNNAYSRQSKRKVGLRLTTGGSDAPGKTYIHLHLRKKGHLAGYVILQTIMYGLIFMVLTLSLLKEDSWGMVLFMFHKMDILLNLLLKWEVMKRKFWGVNLMG